jgi:hypothetical protein
MLPSHLIVDMFEFLINESFGTFHALEFIEYLRNKLTSDSAKRIIYFSIIKNATKYEPITTNSTESTNRIPYRYISSLSKSPKLNTILKNSRSFFTAEFRKSERQRISKCSDYWPSKDALLNFERSRAFVNKINKTSVLSRTLELLRKSAL